MCSTSTGSTSLPADVTGGSCTVQLIEIVPLTSDIHGASTMECDAGDWAAEVKEEILPILKLELDDVSYILCSVLFSETTF